MPAGWAPTASTAPAPTAARSPVPHQGGPIPPPCSTGPARRSRRSSRHTGSVEGYEASTYGDRFADVYDDWYGDVTDAEACARRVADLVAERGGGAVLELGIGSGRLALPLAALGIEVHGIDASDAMLEQLRAKPGGNALDLDGRGHGRARARRSTAVRRRVRRVQHVLQPRARPRRSAVVSSGSRRCSRPRGCSSSRRSCRSRATTHPPERAWRRGGSPRTRSVLSVSQHDADEQTVTGQHIHVTEAGIRLRPWHLRYAYPERARCHGRGRRPPARVASRRLGRSPVHGGRHRPRVRLRPR